MTVVSFPVGFGYGLLARENGLPLGSRNYFVGSFLITFILYFTLYQVATWSVFHRADADQLERWIRLTTPRTRSERRLITWTGSGTRSWALTAAFFALAVVLTIALVEELRTNPVIIVSSLLVVATGWTMVVYAYAVAYLRKAVESGGLEFPEQPHPLWSDYFYVSVQIMTTFSSSDVTVTTTAMRRTVTGHSLIAFIFNTVIVALLVSTLLAAAG